MRELKIGERIPIEAGGEAVVSRELGRGGQGIVYLVRYNGREYALKWYCISRIKNPEAFRNNLRKNIEDGAVYLAVIFNRDKEKWCIWLFDATCSVRI